MRILITGVGDAFVQSSFGSSALIEAPGGFVQIDCPDPIHRVWKEATSRAGWHADASSIHDVIITHLHGDHCNGLESFGFWRRIARMQNRSLPVPRLHTTKEVASRLWEKLAPAMDGPMGDARPSNLADYFDVRVIQPGKTFEVAGLSGDCRFTKHPIPTIGLLLNDGSRTFGWSSDTPFEQAHVDWLSRADLIVHESNLGPAHTPIEQLNALPANIKKRMRLIHLPDGFDPARTDIAILCAGHVLTV
jgi:ribonuclease BN (tRNA processing enzyme)